MDIGGIIGKIESNADALGALVGGLGAVHSHTWGRDIPKGISYIIEALVKDPHIPNLAHVFEATKNSEVFMPGIMALVGGYALETVDLDDRLKRAGKAFKKAGFGALLAAFAVNALIYSGVAHSDGGADHGMHHQLYSRPQEWGGRFTMPTVAPTRNIGLVVAGVPQPS